MKIHALLLSVLVLTACTGRAAYLEPPDEVATGRGVVTEIAPRPPPRGFDPLDDILERVTVGRPGAWGRLTVFPLVAASPHGHSPGVLTLDQALAAGVLTVQELGQAQVPRLVVRNRDDRRVFLMAGEILLGGKQNRLVRDDVLLPPRSGDVEIPVYCGEKRRWEGAIGEFKSGSSLVAPAVRGMAAGGAAQKGIWSAIDAELNAADVRTPTRDYQALYEDEAAQRRLGECVDVLSRCFRPGNVGCVVALDGRIVGADVFGDGALFSVLRTKILRSYAAGHPGLWQRETHRRRLPGIGVRDVRAFLRRVAAARRSPVHHVGIGKLFRLRGSVTGSVLVDGKNVVHAAAFPGTVRPVPIDPIPVPYPRSVE